MRVALTGGVLAVALTLGGVAPASATGEGSTAPDPVAVQGTCRNGSALRVDAGLIDDAHLVLRHPILRRARPEPTCGRDAG